MSTTNIDLSLYKNKTSQDTLTALEWNALMATLEDTLNTDNAITDVKVGTQSVVSNGVAQITIPVTDIKRNGVSIVSNGVANIIDDVEEEEAFYVNDIKRTPTNGIIALASGNSYTLKGVLTGRVTIGAATENSLTDDTYVLLDGVTIKNNSTENSGIEYLSDSQSMIVTLAKNSINKITCSHVAAIADGQKAALFSEKNMVLQGNGYLAIQNKGGHGIKASELRISGRPHIYIDASHDGIHGNNVILIHGGVYYIKNANDAFGTRAAIGTIGDSDYKAGGHIYVFDGDFSAYDIKQNVFDSKSTGYLFSNVGIKTNCVAANILSGITKIDPAVYYGNAVQNTSSGGYSTAVTPGTVKCYPTDAMSDDSEGITTITAVDGVYTLTSRYARISGYIEGSIVAPLTDPDDDNAYSFTSVDIELNNAYILGSITYSESKKKVQITAVSGTVNYIIANTGNAITSNSNASIEVKKNGYLELYAPNGSGIVGDEITLNDSKGVLVIKNCGTYGIKGKDFYIGTVAGTVAAEDVKYLEGAVILYGNKVADLAAVLNSKFKKGAVKVLRTGLKGILSADHISVEGNCDLGSSSNVFYHEANGIVLGTSGETVEDAKFVAI